jgi:hypothetical protein
MYSKLASRAKGLTRALDSIQHVTLTFWENGSDKNLSLRLNLQLNRTRYSIILFPRCRSYCTYSKTSRPLVAETLFDRRP